MVVTTYPLAQRQDVDKSQARWGRSMTICRFPDDLALLLRRHKIQYL